MHDQWTTWDVPPPSGVGLAGVGRSPAANLYFQKRPRALLLCYKVATIVSCCKVVNVAGNLCSGQSYFLALATPWILTCRHSATKSSVTTTSSWEAEPPAA